MIIQTIGLDPSGAIWTDEPSNVSRLDPSGADQADAKHPTRNRKVEGSNLSSGSKTAGQRVFLIITDDAAATGGHSFSRMRRRRRTRPAGPAADAGVEVEGDRCHRVDLGRALHVAQLAPVVVTADVGTPAPTASWAAGAALDCAVRRFCKQTPRGDNWPARVPRSSGRRPGAPSSAISSVWSEDAHLACQTSRR
jgi:hypothetical protein